MLYIRVDMNETIATGHLMRCLSIADAARCRGEETTFLLADCQAVGILKEREFPYLVLNTDWNNMDAELPVMKRVISEKDIGCLLVDSYQVTKTYLEELNKMTVLVYIDDISSFLYPVDMIICYASYWEKFQYSIRYPGKQLLLGTRYVPLRKEFNSCPRKIIKDEIETLVILSGGTDKYNVIDKLLEKIEMKKYRKIIAICGTYYTKYEYICEKFNCVENIEIYRAVKNMKDYMDMADLIITAGGTTLYEICAVGTPAISYSVADNQLDNVKAFQKDEIIDYAGDIRREYVVGNILNFLELYHKDHRLRAGRSLKMQSLVDGKGALRIAEKLESIQKNSCTVASDKKRQETI